MTARQEAIAHYGGRCAYCGSTDRLELDHLQQGTGNTHRRQIQTKLAYWLKAQGWPDGIVQLLCKRCHDLKSGRIRTMPPRKGTTDLHVAIRDDVAQQLAVLAAAPGSTKAEIVEAALLAHISGGASEALLAGVHQRLDTLTSQVTTTLTELAQVITTLQGEVKNLTGRLDQQDRRYEEVKATVASLYHHLKPPTNGAPKGMFSSMVNAIKGHE
jgi:hypothetical protein